MCSSDLSEILEEKRMMILKNLVKNKEISEDDEKINEKIEIGRASCRERV